jgi:hypothetical protein
MESCRGQAAIVCADHINSWLRVWLLVPLLKHTKYHFFVKNPCVDRCQHEASEVGRVMWASVIKVVGLDLFCFSFEFSAAVMVTGIMTVAHSPPLMFVVIGAIAPDRMVGHQGRGVDVLVSHIDVARQV